METESSVTILKAEEEGLSMSMMAEIKIVFVNAIFIIVEN